MDFIWLSLVGHIIFWLSFVSTVFGFIFKNGVDPMVRGKDKPRSVDEVVDKIKSWQLT